MMKRVFTLIFLLCVPISVMACTQSTNQVEESNTAKNTPDKPSIEGPAFVLFYTEN
ncbi:MAG: hypothetical protein AAGD96_00390 [Chloroflexota bacterium]